MKNPYKNSLLRTFLAVIFLLIFNTSLTQAAPARVAILPFDINAEKDMTFLQEGIMDMLASRIAWKDEVEIVNENKTRAALASVEGADSESRALAVGETLDADYVLYGSLTVFGDSVSIDAKMADVTGKEPALPFYAQTQGMGAVIPQINQFAADINATVFGRGAAKQPAATPPPSAMASTAGKAQQPVPTHDPRMHPEKLLQSDVAAEPSVPVAGQPHNSPNPAFVPAARAVSSGDVQTHWRSRRFKDLITGLDIADVDNDGAKDLILATDDVVSIYRMQDGRLVKQAEVAENKGGTILSVDTADINGNGTPEIYVTSLGPNRTTVASFVLEHGNGAYTTLSDGANWYYRIAKTIERGDVLMGQRQRQGVKSIFKEPIQELQWQGDQLKPVQQLLIAGKANVNGVTYGNILNTGGSVIAAYSEHDKLRVYGSENSMLWEDSKPSGGDMLFFNLPREDPDTPNIQYFPLRIYAEDINGDGNTEVLIARHDDMAFNSLKSFRRLKNAKIESLAWNGFSLAPQWTTQSLSGRVSDFTVGDIDNDGHDELVIGLVAKEGNSIFTDSISNVVAFDLKGK